MRVGFTLLEVLVSLVILEISVLGVLGTLVLASETQRRAEVIEHAAARAEGVLDSLRGGATPGTGSDAFHGGVVRWVIDDQGVVNLEASAAAVKLLRVRTQMDLR